MEFVKATKEQSKARIAIIGLSGAGKTWTALTFAPVLGSKVALIDTENGSASKYADEFDFSTLSLADHSPQNYVKAIQAAERAGFDVLIIDSLSHAWSGRGGALEQVDNAAKRSKSGNSFTAWREVTPHHNALVDALVQCSCHLIVTMRAKTEYALQPNDRGKIEPRKIGLAPVQRDGLEYEFDIVADMDIDHNFIISKTRCRPLDGAVVSKPDTDIAITIRDWLTSGEKPNHTGKPKKADEPETAQTRPALSPEKLKEAIEKKAVKAGYIDKDTGELLPVKFHDFGDKTAGLVSAKFTDALENDKTAYQKALWYLCDVESANDLTANQADALLDWLLNGNKDLKFKAVVQEPAPEEAKAVVEAAQAMLAETPEEPTPEAS